MWRLLGERGATRGQQPPQALRPARSIQVSVGCGVCRRSRDCALNTACPIQDWPLAPSPDGPGADLPEPEPLLRHDPDPESTGRPRTPVEHGEPGAVWLTAESLGEADPALDAHPDLPAVFVFDEPLLARLQLSGKRLVFLAETLADLATRRDVEVRRGEVAGELRGRAVAVTHAPVPGFRSRAAALAPTVVHPWRWLYRPHAGPIGSTRPGANASRPADQERNPGPVVSGQLGRRPPAT